MSFVFYLNGLLVPVDNFDEFGKSLIHQVLSVKIKKFNRTPDI